MTTPITVLAPIKLAAGRSEADLLAASAVFEKDFASQQSGILRRELVRSGAGEYIDIVQFRSHADMEDVIAKEKESPACHAFFAVMDPESMDEASVQVCPSLATYGGLALETSNDVRTR